VIRIVGRTAGGTRGGADSRRGRVGTLVEDPEEQGSLAERRAARGHGGRPWVRPEQRPVLLGDRDQPIPLQAEGVTIAMPLTEEDWGERAFQVRDPNGVIVQLADWNAVTTA
jgi:hypothetical protein